MPQIFISSSFFSIHWNDWKRSHQKEAKTGRWKTQYDFVNAYLCCLNCVVESPRDVLISVLKFSWFLACTFLFYQGIISFKYRLMYVHMNAYLMKKTKGKFPWEHLWSELGKQETYKLKRSIARDLSIVISGQQGTRTLEYPKCFRCVLPVIEFSLRLFIRPKYEIAATASYWKRRSY